MKNFLAQFKPYLSPMQHVKMEQRVFNTADQFVENYNGGTWPSFKAGDAWAVAVPSKGDVHIISPMNGADETMDAKSAGLALSILVVSWTWELLAEDMTEAAFRQFETVREQLMSAADSDQYNSSAIFSVID